jgi:hypothetical protein
MKIASTFRQVLVVIAMTLLAVLILAGCGGGDPLPDHMSTMADTGLPRVDCKATPQHCI